MTKINLGGKGLFCLTSCNPSCRKVKQKLKPGTEADPWKKAVYRLLLRACFLCLLLHPGTTCPGMAPPTVGWLGLPTSIIFLKNALQANFVDTFFN